MSPPRREIAETDPSIRMGDGWQGCIRYSNAAEKQAAVAEMTRPRTRIQQRNSETILEAALEVFSQQGFRGATLDQIAEQLTLAVSLEPVGGSPTGKPTGPVLTSGPAIKAV